MPRLRSTAAPVHTLVIGGGLAGLSTALGLLDKGHRVQLLDRETQGSIGGLALHAFGGMTLVDTPLQRLHRVRDSASLVLADWLAFADFGPDDVWPRQWAEHCVSRCVPEVYEWLGRYGIRFIPAVQWVERGWMTRGNSMPRYHVLWGTARHMVLTMLQAMRRLPDADRLEVLSGRWVDGLLHGVQGVTRCHGVHEGSARPFEWVADAVVVAAGGITGDLQRVRQHWPRALRGGL